MAGKLRIIGGRWRGRKLAVADRPELRPTGDRARETLFNWLQGRLHDAVVADLFAGSGALGLEAASRDARRVVLVERDRDLAATLETVRSSWPGSEGVEVVRGDALDWLRRTDGPFDLVFVDPPFDAGLHQPVLAALRRPGLLAANARVYVESRSSEPAPGVDADPAWRVIREKRQGAIRMQLLAPPETPETTAPLPPIPGA